MSKFYLVLCVSAIASLPILMPFNNLQAQAPSQPSIEPTEAPELPSQPSIESTEAPELPSAPDNCVYLKEISTGEIEIRKQVKFGNQNTDFAVPAGKNFTYYIPQLLGENNAKYDVKVYFKYSDGSDASVFEKAFPLKRFERVSDQFESPSERQPYQINFNVNSARNNAYRVSVLGCQ
ncbi:hypothetical protein STA3757_26910 [Stanieria sp. NIES-3757]|nr:hypothetical protein STA3757_26910 [Stanieria sp. NIES-3757]